MKNKKQLLLRCLPLSGKNSLSKACILMMASALCIGEMAICKSDIDNNNKANEIDQNCTSVIQTVSILISLLEYINKQKSSDIPIDTYYKTVFHLQYLLVDEASFPVYSDSQGAYRSGISASNRNKLSKKIDLLEAQYATLKNNAYYNSAEMKKVCEGNDIILPLDIILQWLKENIIFEGQNDPKPEA